MPPYKVDFRKLAAEHEQRMAKWASVVKVDARRTVRAMTIVGFENETIEGDTMWDMPFIINELKPLSVEPTTDAWKRLVSAGVFDAL